MSRSISLATPLFVALLALVLTGLAPAASAQKVGAELVASGLADPLFVTAPEGDFDRLFILEQNSGRVKILRGGQVLATPFLDLGALISSGGERGLLGLAFHPDYLSNGLFFVNYTNPAGSTVVARYQVSASNPDVADPSSAAILLTIPQPFSNHNGGMLAFGPLDGYLYIGTGDGGAAGDPGNRAQSGGTLLGKLLRLDVDSGSPYGIPGSNPFVNDPNFLDEIWAFGLRNPWRYSFDRVTGDLYIGDVGQDLWEEVDFQPGASPGGENYGWRLKEGTHCFNPPTNCDPGGLTDPIYEYSHGGFPNFRCSITGGYVYRGGAISGLQGTYFFADWCSRQVWSFRYLGGQVVDFRERTAELQPVGANIRGITSFGEGADGELYIVDGNDGEVFKIVPRLLDLSLSALVAGQSASATVGSATPGGVVFLAYSLSGTGLTPVPPLGVFLGLDQPRLWASRRADAQGTAVFAGILPAQAAGRQIWAQAAESGNTSILATDTIR